MRDLNRITEFCNMLQAYLYTGDDQKAMQLVHNLQKQIEKNDLYLEDGKTMKLKELKSILRSNIGQIQMAIVYDRKKNKDVGKGSIEYVMKEYGEMEVKRISSCIDFDGWDCLVITI